MSQSIRGTREPQQTLPTTPKKREQPPKRESLTRSQDMPGSHGSKKKDRQRKQENPEV
jgi:hypothetical protein